METQQRRHQVLLSHLRPERESFVSHENVSATHQQSTTTNTAISDVVSYSVVEKDGVGVALLILNSPPVNALSDQVLQGISDQYNRAVRDSKVKAIVITSATAGFFVAGADIAQIQDKMAKNADASVMLNQLVTVHKLFKQLESGNKPTVAAIDGVALGGGLELAMSCNARVATPQSKLGLPELKLGIIPGYGGTQRLPRLVGVEKALEIILSSNPVSSNAAKQLGLVDVVVDRSALKESAVQLAADIASYKHKRTQALHLTTRLESSDKIKEIIAKHEANAKKTSSHLPHVQATINAVKAGLEFNGDYGLEAEMKEAMKVMGSPVAQSLIHLFFAEKATSKVPGLKPTNNNIKSLGVIGGGLMGSGIIIVALQSGIPVVLKEINDQVLNAGVQRVRSFFDDRLKKQRISEKQHKEILSRLAAQTNYDGFDKLDMVIEAVIEVPKLKQNIFAELEKVCSRECILATNTSTIDIDIIGANIRTHDRLIGLHFFSPVPVMPLLEIIRTKQTSQNVIATAVNFGKQIRKTSIVVGNCPGFLVNRSFYGYSQIAAYIVDRGANPYLVDRAMQKFGFRVGPFLLADLVGIEVGTMVHKSFVGAFPDRCYNATLNDIMYQNKRLGQKSGLGFYKHDPKTGRPSPDAEIEKFIAQSRKNAGNPDQSLANITEQQIVEYLLFPVVNEACRIIEEGLVYRVSDVDISSVMGMMFPQHRGGLMKWADSIGASYICDKLEEMYKKSNLKIFEPSNYLREHAAKKQSLFVQ